MNACSGLETFEKWIKITFYPLAHYNSMTLKMYVNCLSFFIKYGGQQGLTVRCASEKAQAPFYEHMVKNI